ncbi:MAG TPA: ATP-binding protein [Actinomycetota bacterium]|nr:ATP-binding protein [Actinomycetota bacterium]
MADAMTHSPGRRLPLAASLMTISIGVLVLAGATGIAIADTLAPRLVNIERNTTIALVLVGASLLLVQSTHDTRRRSAGRGIALLVAAAGMAGFVVDGWLAVPAACCFLALGTALLAVHSGRTAVRVSHVLVIGVLSFSLLVVAGSFYGTVVHFTDVGVHSALLFMVSGVGILWIRPGQGLMGPISAPGVGGALARRLLPIVVLFPFVTEWLRSRGEEAGLFGPELGLAIGTVALVSLLVCVIWIAARLLARGEAAVFSSMADGAMSLDPSGRIVSINKAMEALAGVGQAQVKGRPYFEAFRFVDKLGVSISSDDSIIERAIAQKDVVAGHGYDVAIESQDGRRTPVALSAAPVLGLEDELAGVIAVVRDVSIEEEIDELKSSLISTVSHELRTPLTMIQGFSELLRDRRLDPEDEREAIDQIATSSERLGRLVNDLLSIARLDSGRIDLHIAPHSIAALTDEAVDSFRHAAAPIRIMDLSDLPPVLVDRDKLIQVITNLVSNAIKYSPPGAPVTISGTHVEDYVAITVTDQGIGIDENEMSGLFQKFYRVDRDEVRDVSGTGLGLYIAKGLIEAQGGEMWVASQRGHGSSFTLSIPSSVLNLAEGGDHEKEVAYS